MSGVDFPLPFPSAFLNLHSFPRFGLSSRALGFLVPFPSYTPTPHSKLLVDPTPPPKSLVGSPS